MARKKASLGKQPVVPEASQTHKKKQQSQVNLATFKELRLIEEEGRQQHLQAETTQKSYKGHVCSVLRSGPVRSWTPFLGGPGPGPVLQISEKGRTEDWTT